MPKSFLCWKLETGGIIIGWLLLLANIGSCVCLVYFIVDRFTNEAVSTNDKETRKQHPTFFLFMYLFIFVVMSLASYSIGVSSVKQRDTVMLRFAMQYWTFVALLSAVLVVAAFISIANNAGDPVIVKCILAVGILCIAVFSYFVCVLRSLREKFTENPVNLDEAFSKVETEELAEARTQ